MSSDDVKRRAVRVLQEMNAPNTKEADAPEGDGTLSRCLVYCRLRPENKNDYEDGGFPLITLRGNQVILKDERHYDYDGTFGPDSTQEEVFHTVAVPCIEHAFNGFRSALMCYGQTGTGKTYTMCNTEEAVEGIIPRASRLIFEKQSENLNKSYQVTAQFVQIYRDHLGDLMSSTGKERVEIHYDDAEGVSLLGCSSHVLSSPEEFMNFYNEGNARRVTTATAMNPESSRGHTAMIIWISSENPDDPAAGKTTGKITFIDLAGYERFSKTGISSSNPIMKDEAKTINASLLALGHVVSSLSSGSKHIPWRNSKLTRILQDSIGGNSRTSIILTIGPSSNHLYETTNSLQFGMRAMAVKVDARVSVNVDYMKLSEKLMNLLEEKDQKISSLELQIASRDAERQQLLDSYINERNLLEEKFSKDLETLTASGATEEQINNLKDIHRVEMQNLIEQQNEEIGYQDEIHSKEINRLIQEQKHQEAKDLTAMKLAQERLIEEFQQKLDSAREGKNEDLVEALRKVSEKDAVLASRASDTAGLHSCIARLSQQVRDMGGIPVKCPSFPEVYLDVSQVEEMQSRLQSDLERERNKVVELRTQLDRIHEIANQYKEEINELRAVNENLKTQITQAGVQVSASDEQVRKLKNSQEEMVSSSEMETLRLDMQAQIDDLKAERDDLKTRLEESENQPRHETPLSQYEFFPRSRANSMRRASETPISVESPTVSESEGRLGAMRTAYKKMIATLSEQLSESRKAYENCSKRLSNAKELLRKHNITFSDQPTDELEHTLPPNHEEEYLRALILIKDDELDAQGNILDEQERQLSKARGSLEHLSQLVATLREKLKEAQIDTEETVSDVQPVDGLPLEDYTALLRKVRESNRRVTMEMLKRSGVERDPQLFNEELEERDQMLELKDELLLEKSAMAQYMARMSARLISQMEAAGINPCCSLPQSYEELANDELGQFGVQNEKQQELEERLAKEREEKERIHRLLNALDEERQLQAAVLNAAETRNKELEERESKATETIHRLAEQKPKGEGTRRGRSPSYTGVDGSTGKVGPKGGGAESWGSFERLFGK